jgi:hypothetical protein
MIELGEISMPQEYDIPVELAHHLRIGTCSWKYDSWKGLVYDPDKKYRPDDYLADYARHFTTVEIDQWFWSLFPSVASLPLLPRWQRHDLSFSGQPWT